MVGLTHRDRQPFTLTFTTHLESPGHLIATVLKATINLHVIVGVTFWALFAGARAPHQLRGWDSRVCSFQLKYSSLFVLSSPSSMKNVEGLCLLWAHTSAWCIPVGHFHIVEGILFHEHAQRCSSPPSHWLLFMLLLHIQTNFLHICCQFAVC